MAFTLFARQRDDRTIGALYGVIVAQARHPAFYADYGVPDTVEGRFDMIVLHLALVVRRLRREPDDVRALGQGVFDAFCRDMDSNLREMGLSDMAVPRRMRAFGEAFYGRAVAYDGALDGPDDGALAAALARNIFRRDDAAAPGAGRLAAYVRAADEDLGRQAVAAPAASALHFVDPLAIGMAAAD